MSNQTFSESWHLIADAHVCLLPAVRAHKQFYRGENWYVLRDPFNNRFYRVRPEAWQFVARLSAEQTVEQAWEACLERHPESAPGQEEVVRLLAQLHLSNLLYFRGTADAQVIFERFRKHRQKEIRAKLLSFLFVRIPLWNPETWLRGAKPLIHFLYSKIGLVIWSVCCLLGLKIAVEHWSELTQHAQGVLAPSNLPWLYLSLIAMKAAHEMSHAMMCKRFGGEVHTMGIMFLIFTPLPYMDASSSWAFRNRWHRVLVGAAGMIAELWLAALAAMVWVTVGEGTMKAVAFNVMLVGSISSLIFNGNPLLRFDAYYMLSDALEIPNLSQRATQQWLYWLEKGVFRCRQLYPVAKDRAESLWLAGFALLSLIYRALITLGIVVFVADQLFFVGVIMFVLSAYMWCFAPMQKALTYLRRSPRLHGERSRAIYLSGGALVLLLVVVGFLPIGDSIRAPGVLEATHFSRVYSAVPGRLTDIHIASGSRVQQGDLLASLINPELDWDMQATAAQLQETQAMLASARSVHIADLNPLQRRMSVLHEKMARLQALRGQLQIYAEMDGIWVAPQLIRHLGAWLALRSELGLVVDPKQFQFNAVVSQEQAGELFQSKLLSGEVRLFADAQQPLTIAQVNVIPYEQKQLPSVALGWLGGGTIEVDTQQGEGRTAKEAFFIVSGELSPHTAIALHGALGLLRCTLPAKPMAVQLAQGVQQFLQKRYRL